MPNQGVSGWNSVGACADERFLDNSSLLPFESLRIARRGERPSAGSFAVASEGRRRWHRCAQISQKSLSESGPLRGGKSVFASPLAVSSFERASKRNSAVLRFVDRPKSNSVGRTYVMSRERQFFAGNRLQPVGRVRRGTTISGTFAGGVFK